MKISDSYDVIVAGGGPAGLGAAIGASRRGARTLLVERYGMLGGVGAWCMGMPINQVRPNGRSRSVVHELLIQHLQKYGEEAVAINGHALVCNVEYLKAAAMDVLDAAGSDYLLHSPIAAALVEDGRCTGVEIATKQGMRRLHARVVVDATGDADVAYFAGAETLKGREGDGFLSPMTLCLLITNVDVDGARAFQASGGLPRLLEQARAKYPLLPQSMGFELEPFPIRNSLVINHSGTKLYGVLDGTRVEDLTIAEQYSRRQAIQIVNALREFGSEPFRNVQLAGAGPQVGVRETRRIKGLYLLTEEDAKTGQRFADAVAWRSGFLDIGFVRFEEMQVHDVPFRALVPEKMDGLLAAGRCISATHVAASAGKSMGNCIATGHAAGLAAAIAADHAIQPRQVAVGELRQALIADGVTFR